MPENTRESTNTPTAGKKKPSLGRGLGSLLGGGIDLDQVASPRPDEIPKQQVTSVSVAPLNTQSNLNTQSIQVVNQPTSQTSIPEEAQIWKIPIDRLVPNTQQPRQTFDQEALKELAASIKEKGILQPITARRLSDREFEIIAGERRWRAAQLAGLHEVPVILKKVSEKDSLEYAIIENIQRENLNPIEEAEAYERLMTEYSMTQQMVADKLGKERSTIANSLRLLTLPPELKVMVRKNELSAGHAKVLLGLSDAQTQIQIAKQVVAERLSVRATEKLVAKTRREANNKEIATTSVSTSGPEVSQRLIESIAADLQKLIGTKVTIDYAGSKGKLQIHFYSDDQLSQIVEKIRASWEK